MKNYRLSIIIPHYNSSDSLEKLLLTIPKDKNIEVLVIDDKSESKHIESINNLNMSGKYVEFLFLKNQTSKKGAGTARNIGLDHAHGEWVLFADADDYFSDNFYESISRYFESDNEVVFFKSTSIYIDTGEVADRHQSFVNIVDNYKREANVENELHIRYDMPIPWSKLIKKGFLEKNNIRFEEVIASNDVMFSTKIGYFMTKFDVSDSIIYVVTRSHGSLTTNLNEQIFDARFQTIISKYNFLKNKLSKEDFKFLNLSMQIRSYIIKSMKYGLIKLIRTLITIQKNDIKFFHYKLLNPVYMIDKTLQYRQKVKKDEKYTINEKL